MTQYKLLIMKTYRQFHGKAWLQYDTAFWKDAPASGLADRSCKNLNLYNFHTCLVPQSQPSAASSPFPNSGSLSSNFCRSRSDSICHWPFGQCWYCHCCDKCERDHPNINCPFRASKSYEQHMVVYRSPKATGHSITGAFQQDLVSPFRVTPTSADKLQQELCFHPDQRRVDFVISGTTGGFFSWL